jgi:hypothetical protein
VFSKVFVDHYDVGPDTKRWGLGWSDADPAPGAGARFFARELGSEGNTNLR